LFLRRRSPGTTNAPGSICSLRSTVRKLPPHHGVGRGGVQDGWEGQVCSQSVWLGMASRPTGIAPMLNTKHTISRTMLVHLNIISDEKHETFSDLSLPQIAEKKRSMHLGSTSVIPPSAIQTPLVGSLQLVRLEKSKAGSASSSIRLAAFRPIHSLWPRHLDRP